ncbi:MAG: hypothetical protein J6O40_03675 [Ruminococcus sp.]|nr:hypothetical protein [Ruminococcus sp.]
MKKILAAALALVMSAAFMTACGDDDSSSSKAKKDTESSSVAATEESSSAAEESSTADESSAADESSTADESSDAPAEAGEAGPLTTAFNEKLKAGKYELEMTAEAMGMTSKSIVKMNGENVYVSLDLLGETIEVYIVDGKAIGIIPSQNAYVEADPNELGIDLSTITDSYTLNDKATYVGSSEEDGLTVETYKVPLDMELGEGVTLESGADSDTELKYCYDADGMLKKIVSNAAMVGESTVEVTKLSFDDVKIELPDTSSMTKVDPNAMADESAADSSLAE